MLNKVINFLEEYNLQNKTIVVGFSGGYDSMCLLDVLYKIRQIDGFYNLKIIAAHFNHNWRGEESYKEQEVCKLFAISKHLSSLSVQPVILKTEVERDATLEISQAMSIAGDFKKVYSKNLQIL